jgi:hypothetical protein
VLEETTKKRSDKELEAFTKKSTGLKAEEKKKADELKVRQYLIEIFYIVT